MQDVTIAAGDLTVTVPQRFVGAAADPARVLGLRTEGGAPLRAAEQERALLLSELSTEDFTLCVGVLVAHGALERSALAWPRERLTRSIARSCEVRRG